METRLQGFNAELTRLSSAFEGFLINAGQPFLDAATQIVIAVRNIVSGVSQLATEYPLLTQIFVAGTTAILAVGGAFTALIVTIGGVIAINTALATVFGVLTTSIPILSTAIVALGTAINTFLLPVLVPLAAGFAFVEIVQQLSGGISTLQLTFSELASFLSNGFSNALNQAQLLFLRAQRSINTAFGDFDAVDDLTNEITKVEIEIQRLNRAREQLAEDAAQRITGIDPDGEIEAVESISENAKRINERRRQEEAQIEEANRLTRIQKAKEEEQEKLTIRKEAIAELQSEINQLQESSFGSFDTSSFDKLFRKQQELIRLQNEGNPQQQERELLQLANQRQQKEDEIERLRLQATEQIKQARINAIEDEQQRELAALQERQNRELAQLSRGGTQNQVGELRAIQEQQVQQLLLRQAEENTQKRIQLDALIEDARIRNIQDSIQRESELFSNRQEDELREFERILQESFGLTQEDVARRVAELEKVQQKEREIFEERQRLESTERGRQLGREFLELDLSRTNDPLEQIRLQNELELSEFQSLQQQKLLQLQEFGASEQEIEEQRLLFKQDLARREAEIRQEAFDAQLALGASTIANARNVGNTLLDISKGNSKEIFALTQGLAIAEATINVARAISNSIGAQGFFGIANAAIAGAAAAAELAKITAVTLGFNQGGFVPGNTSVNRDTVPAMLTPGEGILSQQSVKYYGQDVVNGMIRRTIPKSIFSNAPGRGLSPQSSKTNFNTGGIVSSQSAQNNSRPEQPRTQLTQVLFDDNALVSALSKPKNLEVLSIRIKETQDDIFGN